MQPGTGGQACSTVSEIRLGVAISRRLSLAWWRRAAGGGKALKALVRSDWESRSLAGCRLVAAAKACQRRWGPQARAVLAPRRRGAGTACRSGWPGGGGKGAATARRRRGPRAARPRGSLAARLFAGRSRRSPGPQVAPGLHRAKLVTRVQTRTVLIASDSPCPGRPVLAVRTGNNLKPARPPTAVRRCRKEGRNPARHPQPWPPAPHATLSRSAEA